MAKRENGWMPDMALCVDGDAAGIWDGDEMRFF